MVCGVCLEAGGHDGHEKIEGFEEKIEWRVKEIRSVMGEYERFVGRVKPEMREMLEERKVRVMRSLEETF